VTPTLVVGQVVELVLEGAEEAAVRGVLAEITPDRVRFTLVDSRQPPDGLEPGRLALLRYWTGVGAQVTETSVLAITPGPPLEAEFARPRKVEVEQRRRTVRVATALPVRLRVTRTAVAASREGEDPGALARDLSTGGLRLETDLLLTIDDRVAVDIETPAAAHAAVGPRLAGTARVVRVSEGSVRRERAFTLGVELMFDGPGEQRAWESLSRALLAAAPGESAAR
jgi:hypothetical protein